MNELLQRSFTVSPFPGWIAVVVLFALSIWQLGLLQGLAPLEPIDASDIHAVAGNCLGEIEDAETLFEGGPGPTASDFIGVCLPPLIIRDEGDEIILTSSASTEIGFDQVRLNVRTFEVFYDEKPSMPSGRQKQ